MTDAPHARRQIETGRGENGSLKGKKMSVHAHTHTRAHKDRQDKGKGDKQKEQSWRKPPYALGEGC